MRAVVDTNVWVSGLIAPDGTCGRLLSAVRDRRIEAVGSWDLADEIALVLRRRRLRGYGITEADVRDVLALLAHLLPRVEVRQTVELPASIRDAKDVPVIAAALESRADLIVTGDRDLLDDAELRRWLEERGVRVLTPAEALALLGDAN